MIIAFLYRFFDKIIYVKQFYLLEPNFELVYYLHKALYRLKQILQNWYQTSTNFFKKFGLK